MAIIEENIRDDARRAADLIGEGKIEAAIEVYESMLERDPYCAAALNNRPVLLERMGLFEPALEGFQTLCKLDPDNRQALGDRARVLMQLERFDEALGCYRVLLSLDPHNAFYHNDFGCLLQRMGKPGEALDAYAKALDCKPDFEVAHCNRCELFFQSKRYRALFEASTEASAALPQSGQIMLWKSVALREMGQLDEALDMLDATLARLPDSLLAWRLKGWAFYELGRYDEALQAFDEALERFEDDSSCLNGMALIQAKTGQIRAALTSFDYILERYPEDAGIWHDKAETLQASGNLAAAIKAYDRALAIEPGRAISLNNKATALRDQGDGDAAIVLLERAIKISPARADIHSNLLSHLLYRQDQTAEKLTEAHRNWGKLFGQSANRYTSWPNDRDPGRPLRIGLLSGEMGKHPVAFWLLTALGGLDRESYPVFCYSTRLQEDDITREIAAMAAGFTRVAGLGDEALAERIRADRIDILIELSGHYSNSRLLCMALKPAPVQVSWLGYPYTTGLKAIDYILMDEVVVRPGEESRFVEKVVRLKGGRFCYAPPESAPPVVPAPASMQGWITFGSFNNLVKMNDDVFDLWTRILRRVPVSRMVFKWFTFSQPDIVERYRKAFTDRGIAGNRLEFRAGSDHRGLLASYGDIDVALDPISFGGGGTSCEALWMGVPVITMPGWQPVSRQTESFLHAIRRDEWIARDADHYVEIAADLAGRRLELNDIRLTQRRRMQESPLCDKHSHGRELMEALRWMWRHYLKS